MYRLNIKEVEAIYNGTKFRLGNRLQSNYPLDVLMFWSVIETNFKSYNSELNQFERLYIFECSDIKKTNHYTPPMENDLVYLYLLCGCLEDSIKIFKKSKNYSMLGHISWILGDYAKAKYYYSQPPSETSDPSGWIKYRYATDWDRLIKLNFFLADWESTLDLILKLHVGTIYTQDGEFILIENKVTSLTPFLLMATVSLTKLNKVDDKELIEKIRKTFKVSIDEFNIHIQKALILSEKEIASFNKRNIPKIKIPIDHIDINAAIQLGHTDKSRNILLFINNLESNVYKASIILKNYIESRDDVYLKDFINLISLGTTNKIVKTFIMIIISGEDLFEVLGNKLDSLQKLFYSHPVIRNLFFSDLLTYKIGNNIPITGLDLLTGIFQYISSIGYSLEGKNNKLLKYENISDTSSWAELNLQKWIDTDGKEVLSDIVSKWISKNAQLVKNSPWHEEFRYPDSPRNMREWKEMIKLCHKWLTERWEIEIGADIWKSESMMFTIAKDIFKDKEIIRHARPSWLSPQHLDIFIPELKLAIEYNGQQHYDPIVFFGGEDGLRDRRELDKRKESLCKLANVNLEYIKFDQNIYERLKEINSKIAQ